MHELPLGERILNGQGPELSELLELVGEAVTVRDQHDAFLYANRTALRELGFASVPELRAHPDSSLLDRFVVYDESGNELRRAMMPTPRAAAGVQEPPATLIQVVDRVTGRARWEQVRVTALRDRAGRVTATVTVAENVTAVKTAEVHTRMLSETGRILSSSLDYQQTLRNVAWAAVPALADWCLVELADEPDRRRERVVVAHRDPDRRDLAGQLAALESGDPAAPSTSSRVIDTGDSELLFDATDADLVRIARGPGQLRVLRELGMRSAIVVPMRVTDRTIGAISFFTSDSLRRLTEQDLALAEQLGRRAAVAVEHSRLHTTLAEVADTLVQSLMPTPLPELPGWEIAALYQPATSAERIEIGGDFYEVFDAGAAPLALIGDVTGHGLAAATLTGLMRHGARFSGRLEPEPDAVLRHLDEELRNRASSAMCTALCARIGERRLVVASAGHPPALHLAANGDVTEAPAPGPLLGAFEDAEWCPQTLPVAPGELVLLYTDGITETASGVGERYGIGRLRRFLSAHAGIAPEPLLRALDAELGDFRGGEPTDDVAALALTPSG
jgi:serine phosphatase RsbU (regulator of sigma subunit)